MTEPQTTLSILRCADRISIRLQRIQSRYRVAGSRTISRSRASPRAAFPIATGKKASILATIGPRIAPASCCPRIPMWCRSQDRTGPARRFTATQERQPHRRARRDRHEGLHRLRARACSAFQGGRDAQRRFISRCPTTRRSAASARPISWTKWRSCRQCPPCASSASRPDLRVGSCAQGQGRDAA